MPTSRDDDVMRTKVWEPNQQLLVQDSRAWVIGYHDRLPHAFDPEGLTETPVRIKFTSNFARRNHGVFELTPQPSNEASTVNAEMDDVTFKIPMFDPDGPGIDDDYSFDLPDPHPPPPWSLRCMSSSS